MEPYGYPSESRCGVAGRFTVSHASCVKLTSNVGPAGVFL